MAIQGTRSVIPVENPDSLLLACFFIGYPIKYVEATGIMNKYVLQDISDTSIEINPLKVIILLGL